MKRIYNLILVLALLLGLCACGQKGPTWQEQYDLGIKYLEDGNYEEAIIAFTAAIEIDPKRAEAYVGRGDAYVLSGETEENLAAAQADYEEAIALDESNARAYLGLADVYIRRGEYDKALEILRQGLEKTGSDQGVADKIAEMESGEDRDSNGTLRRRKMYENGVLNYCSYYDAEGRVTYSEVYDPDGTINNYNIFEYSADGRTKTQKCYIDDELWHTTTYIYREDGKQERIELIHADGSYAYYELFEYDNSGMLVKSERYDISSGSMVSPLEGGKLRYYTLWEYDANGNQTKMTNYNADGTLDYYQTYEYDADGKLKTTIRHDSDGTERVYTYDED